MTGWSISVWVDVRRDSAGGQSQRVAWMRARWQAPRVHQTGSSLSRHRLVCSQARFLIDIATVRATNRLSGKTPNLCPALCAKIFRFRRRAKHLYIFAYPASLKGRWPSSWTLGRVAVDAAASGMNWNRRAGYPWAITACRRTALKRKAKPRGPGTRCWCQVGGVLVDPTGSDKTSIRRWRRQERIRLRGDRGI